MARTVQDLAAARAAAYARRLDVARRILAGENHSTVARALNVAPSTITGDVQVIRGWWRERASADYDVMVHEEIARLDALLESVMPRATGGSLQAVDRVLSIIDLRIRLLGLEAPKHQVVEADYVVRQYVGIDPHNFDQAELDPLSGLAGHDQDESDQHDEGLDDLSA